MAARLGLSPATVAAAYAELRRRGLVVGRGRQGTRLAPRPPLASRRATVLPEGLRDAATGGPDPTLLPRAAAALRALRPQPAGYGAPEWHPDLWALVEPALAADGVPAGACTLGAGAMDGITRVLDAHLRPGDRVAVEDPAWAPLLDGLAALGLAPVPVPVDDDGPSPGGLADALAKDGARAAIVTPRAQNPTGAAITPARARALRAVLRRHPSTLLVEDDHAGPVAGAPLATLAGATEHWALVRSLSKFLGPDLRVALVAGDEDTIARVRGRYALGPGWVSHVTQQLCAALWVQAAGRDLFARAAAAYGERRQALVAALGEHGLAARGRSGLNVWVPVPRETPVVQAAAAAGWAITPGEAFRLAAPPAVRVTVSNLRPTDAPALADAIAGGRRGTGWLA